MNAIRLMSCLRQVSHTTPGTAAACGFRFPRTDKGAREPAVHVWSESIDVKPGFRQERSRILDVVYPPRLDLYFGKPSSAELGVVLTVFKRPGDAADP